MSVASILLLALLAPVASASENPRPLVEHSIRVDGHVKCGGVPLENATVNLVFVVPNPDKEASSDNDMSDSDEPTDYNKPVSSVDFLNYGSSHFDYPTNDTLSLNLTKSVQSASSFDYGIGNNSDPGEGLSGFEHPDNDTDIASFDLDRTDVDPVGRGASLESKEQVSAGDGIDEAPSNFGFHDGRGQQMPDIAQSEFEDFLDRTLTSENGAYHIEGKILYAPGDDTWKLYVRVDHKCDNGTIKNDIPFYFNYKQDLSVYEISSQGKKQFQIDVDLNADESEEYKTGASVDY